MIKIYYNAQTGDITEMMSMNGFSLSTDPFIEVPEKIKINEYRVDLGTLELVKIEP